MEPTSPADRTGATTPREHGYREHLVPRGGHRIYARECPGQEPAIMLLHGFPDNSRIYDRLVPLLAPRRAVALDWLGYGRSDRAGSGPLGDAAHRQQLDAVLGSCGLARWCWWPTTPPAHRRSTGRWRTHRGSPGWCCSTPTTAICPGCERLRLWLRLVRDRKP
jgi:pimeloyl-ACP methyl ester carboxylesterase